MNNLPNTEQLLVNQTTLNEAVAEIFEELSPVDKEALEARINEKPEFINAVLGIVNGMAYLIMLAKMLASDDEFAECLGGLKNLDKDIRRLVRHVLDQESQLKKTLLPRAVTDEAYLRRLSLIRNTAVY